MIRGIYHFSCGLNELRNTRIIFENWIQMNDKLLKEFMERTFFLQLKFNQKGFGCCMKATKGKGKKTKQFNTWMHI